LQGRTNSTFDWLAEHHIAKPAQQSQIGGSFETGVSKNSLTHPDLSPLRAAESPLSVRRDKALFLQPAQRLRLEHLVAAAPR
jgi:hypothetical protein